MPLAARPLLALLAVALCACDVPRGEAAFERTCARCHSRTDTGSGQGPGLAGLFGRPAASGRNFGYSAALRQSGIVWDAQSLDRFLAGPGAHIPGTLMLLTVPDPGERRALIAFLRTLHPPAPR